MESAEDHCRNPGGKSAEQEVHHRRCDQRERELLELGQLHECDILQVRVSNPSPPAMLTLRRWPVIAVIIIVGLILLSIVTCIVRCCCCATSCCCSCFSCLNCCCGSACDGKKRKESKHKDDTFNPSTFANVPPSQGYHAPAPMPVMGGGLAAPPAPSAAPQYAQFEIGKNGLYTESKSAPSMVSEDALPPMPSWDAASKKHVVTEDEKAIELGNLDPSTGQKMPLMAAAAGLGVSAPPSPAIEFPHSPYGARPVQGRNGYSNVAVDQFGQQNRAGYNASPAPSMGGFQGPPNPAMGGPGRYGSPAPSMAMGGQPRYGSPAPQAMNRPPRGPPGPGMGMGAPPRYGSPGPQAMNRPQRGFGPPSPQDSYSPQDQQYPPDNKFDSSAASGYGRPPPSRQYTGDSYASNNQQYPPPNRQLTNEPSRPMLRQQYSEASELSAAPSYPGNNYQQDPPHQQSRNGPQNYSPALSNNSGFDFGGGSSGGNGGYQSQPSAQPTHFNDPVELESIPSPMMPQEGFAQQQQRQGGGERRRASPPQQPHEESGYGGFGDGGMGPSSYGVSARSAPPPQQQQEPSYPGYKPYQPANGNGGRNGVSSPRGEGQREPQGWDPVR